MSIKRKKPTKATTAETPSLPTIINIADFRAASTGPTLLHFTAEQWKAALKNGKRVKSLPRSKVTFEAVPMPSRDGDMLVSPRGCPKGYSSVLRFIPAGSPNGLTPEPDTYDTIQPQCISENGDDGRPSVYPFTGCQMVVNLPRQPFRPPISCASTTCRRRCVLQFVRGPGNFFQAGCVCRS